MSNRKVLIKTSTIAISNKTLIINIEINNEDMWYVRVTSKDKIFETPCKLDSLKTLFDLQKDSWNVIVLGKWINSDGRNFIKLD